MTSEARVSLGGHWGKSGRKLNCSQARVEKHTELVSGSCIVGGAKKLAYL